MYNSIASGAEIADELYSNKVDLDADAMNRFINGFLDTSPVLDLVKETVNILTYAGVVDIGLDFIEDIYDKVSLNLMPRLIREIFGTCPGWWGMVSPEAFEDAKAFVLESDNTDGKYDKLIQNHCAWVLSRLKVKFLSTPKWQDKYTITTWHKGMQALFSMRDFSATLDSEPEKPIIVCTSSWLIMDLNTRRLLRAEHVLGEDIFTSAHHEDAIAEPCGKLVFPKEMEKVHTRRVVHSDIDMNLHTNNAKYMEWAFDILPIEETMQKEVDEFQINFNMESKLNDTITINTCPTSPETYYIEGISVDGKNIFQTNIKFKK